jgi:hypothetical protein
MASSPPAADEADDLKAARADGAAAGVAAGMAWAFVRVLSWLMWWLVSSARWLVAVPLLILANVLALVAGSHPMQGRIRRHADVLFGTDSAFMLGWATAPNQGRGLTLVVENVQLGGALLRRLDSATMADPLVLRSATVARLRITVVFAWRRALTVELTHAQAVLRVAERRYWDGARARERWAAAHSANIAALAGVLELRGSGGSRGPTAPMRAGVESTSTVLARLMQRVVRQTHLQARQPPRACARTAAGGSALAFAVQGGLGGACNMSGISLTVEAGCDSIGRGRDIYDI